MSNYYLQDIPIHEAQAIFDERLAAANLLQVLGSETIPLNEKAAGRVLAEAVWAKLSSPHYHASAMDGFAVHSSATIGATQTSPIVLSVSNRTTYLDTGDPLPEWADAVVPIEETEPLTLEGKLSNDPRKPDSIRIRAAVTPWKHVRPIGEDLVASQLVLPAGQVLKPVDLGAAAAAGYGSLTVARKPTVAIIPSGNELVPVGSIPLPGDIIEFNSVVLAAQIESWGGLPVRLLPLPDDRDVIRDQLSQAANEYDLILLLAGSSAGSEDFSAEVIAEIGDLLIHGVAVRPGHPVILGMLEREAGGQRPVIGVPGYPVSSALTGEIFVERIISIWLGKPANRMMSIRAEMTRKITSPAGDDDYVRVVVGKVGEKHLAAPLARGAGVITSLVRADGIVILPRGTQGASAGEQVEVQLYRHPDEIESTILATGSHDLTLDLLAQFLAPRGSRLSSSNVGSLGGLLALRRNQAHLAGSHLLDPQTGEYNLPFVSEYLPGRAVRIYCLVHRQQGLIIAKGNPKGISGLNDLTRRDLTYVNRQRGAGTRILVDYQMDLMGIAPDQVRGYNHEEFTHLAVAAVISSGRADCGLGIAAAADALNLDFLPLHQERYDLIVPTEIGESTLLNPLWEILKDREFIQAVRSLPGYDIQQTGQLIADIPE